MGSIIGGAIQAGATVDAANTEAQAAEQAARLQQQDAAAAVKAAQTGYNYLTTGAGSGAESNYINEGQTGLGNEQTTQNMIAQLLGEAPTPASANWNTSNPAQAPMNLPGNAGMASYNSAVPNASYTAPITSGDTSTAGGFSLAPTGSAPNYTPPTSQAGMTPQSMSAYTSPSTPVTSPVPMGQTPAMGSGVQGGNVSLGGAPNLQGTGATSGRGPYSQSNPNALVWPNPANGGNQGPHPQQQTQPTQQTTQPSQGGGVAPSNANSAFQNYLNSTGYQFQLGQGAGAIMANAGSTGLLDSGANAKALEQYGQNLSSTTFNNYLSELGGLESQQANTAGAGQNALSTIGSVGTASGTAAGSSIMTGAANQGNLMMQGANAQGNAIAGLGGSLGNMFSQFGGASNNTNFMGGFGGLFGGGAGGDGGSGSMFF